MHAEDEDREIRAQVADFAQGLQRADAGHGYVQHQDVGRDVAHDGHGSVRAGGLTDNLHVRYLGDDLLQALPHDRMIVGDDDADHSPSSLEVSGARGNEISTTVPVGSARRIVVFPPRRSARSRIPSKPNEVGACSSASTIPRPSS